MCISPMKLEKPKHDEISASWQQYFIGGWTAGALHLVLIATTFIHPLSAPATGTVCVHSWFLGWLLVYRWRGGLDDRWVRVEAAILLGLLFQLAVGAFAFSRIYNGPLFGQPKDVFQTLSVIYMREETWIPEFLVSWWAESSQKRFTGLGWYICDIADVLAHQAPFILLYRIVSRQTGGWVAVKKELRKVWPVAILAGPIHRIIWDFSTCGHSFCDGPYRGFLQEVAHVEQFLWHFLPGIVLVPFLLLRRSSISVLEQEVKIL